MKKNMVIFTISKANELIKAGFPLRKIAPAKKAVGQLVFYFDQTNELESYVFNKK